MEKNIKKPTESLVNAMKAKGYNYAILIDGQRDYLFVKTSEMIAQIMREDFPKSRLINTIKLS